jgi:2-polyprenyl-3-methyl-5-hydroxy-6-metoxy-1,4-benzoquinol methylase
VAFENNSVGSGDLASDSKSAYEAWHDLHDVDSEANSPWHELVKKWLSPSRDLAGKKVLEMACGRGGFTCWLAQQPEALRPAAVVAADFSATAVAKGRMFSANRGLSDIAWEIGDIQAIAHADSSFDTVISCETIEHVPSSRKAIEELARVLCPGGRLFLTTPNYMGTLGLFRAYLRLCGRPYTEVGQPINRFLMLPLTRSWVARAGLRVQTVDAVGHFLPFPGRPPIEMPALNNPRILMRWFALHSLVVAVKP